MVLIFSLLFFFSAFANPPDTIVHFSVDDKVTVENLPRMHRNIVEIIIRNCDQDLSPKFEGFHRDSLYGIAVKKIDQDTWLLRISLSYGSSKDAGAKIEEGQLKLWVKERQNRWFANANLTDLRSEMEQPQKPIPAELEKLVSEKSRLSQILNHHMELCRPIAKENITLADIQTVRRQYLTSVSLGQAGVLERANDIFLLGWLHFKLGLQTESTYYFSRSFSISGAQAPSCLFLSDLIHSLATKRWARAKAALSKSMVLFYEDTTQKTSNVSKVYQKTHLDEQTAQALIQERDDVLYLDNLTKLTPKVATILSTWNGHYISLKKLSKPTKKTAAELAKWNGFALRLGDKIGEPTEVLADRGIDIKQLKFGVEHRFYTELPVPIKEPLQMIELDNISMRLRNNPINVFLNIDIIVETAYNTRAKIEEQELTIRDYIVLMLSDYSFENLDGFDGKSGLKDELQLRIEHAIKPFKIKNLYFSKFVFSKKWVQVDKTPFQTNETQLKFGPLSVPLRNSNVQSPLKEFPLTNTLQLGLVIEANEMDMKKITYHKYEILDTILLVASDYTPEQLTETRMKTLQQDLLFRIHLILAPIKPQKIEFTEFRKVQFQSPQ